MNNHDFFERVFANMLRVMEAHDRECATTTPPVRNEDATSARSVHVKGTSTARPVHAKEEQ